jgi:hypothetical protein
MRNKDGQRGREAVSKEITNRVCLDLASPPAIKRRQIAAGNFD